MKNSSVTNLAQFLGTRRFGTVLADPPWRFVNRTGKVAPEHRRLTRYDTLSVNEIADLPVIEHVADRAHCYLWVPNALLPEGLQVLSAWGFEYKTNIIWHKIRKDAVRTDEGLGSTFKTSPKLSSSESEERMCVRSTLT